jgi:hypothetical protein
MPCATGGICRLCPPMKLRWSTMARNFSPPIRSVRRHFAALDQFGAQGLTELTTLMGYYALLAFNANAFEIDIPAQRTESLLPI